MQQNNLKYNTLQFIKYTNVAGALYIIATIIFNNFTIHQYGYYVFFLSYIAEFIIDKRWQNFKFTKIHIYYLGMVLFFILPLLYYPFDTTTYFKLLIEKRYPLLGIGIIGFFGLNDKYKLNYFLNTIIISAVAVILYLLIFKVGIINFITRPDRDALFTLGRTEAINQHMMFNFYLNLALISIWYMISRSWQQTKPINRILYISAMTLIFFVLYLSEGRSGFLAGILLMCAFVFFEIWKRKRTLSLLLALLIPFILVLFASGHKRISKESFQEEPRLFLWEAATEVIEESPVWGNGISRAQEKYDTIRNIYETPEYRHHWHEVYHARLIDCHNQYLQIIMEFGVLGILFVIFLYCYPFFIVEPRRKLLSFFILTLCAYQSIFDMFITGPFCLIFCFLTLLLLRMENNIDIGGEEKIIKQE